jgi:hypothetical protein
LDEEGRETIWKEYMEKFLNEENEWDQDVSCEKRKVCTVGLVRRR